MAKITLITGSTMGSAEYVAEHIEEKLQEMDFETETLHGPRLDELPLDGIWLVVCSTHGAGELPDNIQPLAKQIKESKADLSQLSFATVGIGSSDYDTFCGAIRTINIILEDHGAKRIGDPLEIDVNKYDIPEDPAEEWVKKWANNLEIA